MTFVSRWYPSNGEDVTDVGGLSAMILRKHPLPASFQLCEEILELLSDSLGNIVRRFLWPSATLGSMW